MMTWTEKRSGARAEVFNDCVKFSGFRDGLQQNVQKVSIKRESHIEANLLHSI